MADPMSIGHLWESNSRKSEHTNKAPFQSGKVTLSSGQTMYKSPTQLLEKVLLNTKSASPQKFTLTILGKNYHPITHRVFDSNDFILPKTRVGTDSHKPKSRKEKMASWDGAPLSDGEIEIYGLMHRSNPFHHLAKAIDTSRLTLSIPVKGIKLKVKDLREEATKAAPVGTKINAAFETYAKEKYGHSYTGLIKDARSGVIARFKAVFAENLDYHPMSDEYNTDKEIFLHPPVWAPESSIKEYKSLAKQGHVYSQYLAGLFLASSAGGYKDECVEYLLMAYENKQPEAMRVLAEFLLFKKDNYGAAQCALLSIDGGDDYSKKIFREVLGITSDQMMQTNRGLVPLSHVIIVNLRVHGFNSILNEHFSEFNPEPHPVMRTPGFTQGGGHE
ncbi:SEL1-like repeat protein [Rahnella aquatilis]|uniref:hypothetical protein n=1 Tax=Rahnella aquatilis TaxID=34038 RepID=UPI003659A2DD